MTDPKRALREALERACAAEDVDLARLEGFVKVANMAGNERLMQSRWVRVIWRLLHESEPVESGHEPDDPPRDA